MLLVALKVWQGVVAIHVNHVKLTVECRVILLAEEIVQVIVLYHILIAPDDQSMFLLNMRRSFHHTDVIILMPMDAVNVQTYQVVEGIHQIHRCIYQLIVASSLDGIIEGTYKILGVDKAITRLCVEHIAQHIALIIWLSKSIVHL